MEPPAKAAPKKRRGWRAISLRAMLLLVLAVGGLMGWWARKAQLQRAAVARIEAAGGAVLYEFEVLNVTGGASFEATLRVWEAINRSGGDADSIHMSSITPPAQPWKGRARKALGVDYVDSVIQVIAIHTNKLRDDDLAFLADLPKLEILNLGESPIGDPGMVRIGRLRGLKSLHLDPTYLTDAGFAHLKGLDRLEHLDLGEADFFHPERLDRLERLGFPNPGMTITDATLARLKGMKKLRTLILCGSSPKITDAGLESLGNLTNLELLRFGDTHATVEGIRRLRAALPNTRIIATSHDRFIEVHSYDKAEWQSRDRPRSSLTASGSPLDLVRFLSSFAGVLPSMSNVHAMPVMLLVLAILAVAYRYYSAFLAARVAALDDSKITPAHEFNDGQNFHPTNRWVLFGHHFAAISGAGPLIGPVLAIQFGYLPGLVWLVVGVCLAGAVQDMMVLASSVRRGGRSLAGLARTEIGPVAGMATTLAILYVIIIALAGLGIVVVKALGGEEVPMKAGTSLTFPASAPIHKTTMPGGARVYDVPPGSTYRYGEGADQSMVFHEPFRLATPAGEPSGGLAVGPMVLPKGARRLVPGSSWGAFTIACTIPIALAVGWYMYRLRKGKVVEASLLGAVAVLGVTVLGASIPGSRLEPYFSWSKETTTYAIAGYGFVASILPVWLLLCPRDYLSSFLKIGTIALLVVGVCVANPTLQAPMVNQQFASGGGPYFDGPIFPYVFICIMCGAVSGFHALVSSGTTPKMVDRESDVRMIGYGAMLMEGLVGIVALIAAAALPNSMYYDINIDLARRPQFQQQLKALDVDHDGGELVKMEEDVQESLHGRTGGAVTLAVGMARIFSKAMPGLEGLVKYWYHFAIMFEALFILTTIDTGTRIGRFLVQEFLGKLWKPLGDLDRLGPSVLATALVVFGWSYFILTGSVETIWPMFGVANQLLAVVALAVATTVIINAGRARYALVTLVPMCFVATTTTSAGLLEITGKFARMTKVPETSLKGWLNIGLTAMLLALVAIILVAAFGKWFRAIRAGKPEVTTAGA